MPESSFADADNVKAIPLEGLNERIVPESIPIGDLSKLIGLRQNKLGELVRYPGEEIIDVTGLSGIRGLFVFGEYLLIQTDVSLVRARVNELFPDFIHTTPELLPDLYNPGGTSTLNPEDMSYALIDYRTAAASPGAATVAATWNKVPLNFEAADSDGRVTLSGGVITISAGAYPANVRIDGVVSFAGPSNLSGASSNQRVQLRLRRPSGGGATVALGANAACTTANSAANARPVGTATIKGRFALAAATDFELQLYTELSSIYGPAFNTGETHEVYASLEILVEE
jgi:hypothetical protein